MNVAASINLLSRISFPIPKFVELLLLLWLSLHLPSARIAHVSHAKYPDRVVRVPADSLDPNENLQNYNHDER